MGHPVEAVVDPKSQNRDVGRPLYLLFSNSAYLVGVVEAVALLLVLSSSIAFW